MLILLHFSAKCTNLYFSKAKSSKITTKNQVLSKQNKLQNEQKKAQPINLTVLIWFDVSM